ncbi:MAG: hypothetical protein ACJ76Y_24140 [Thermoanaerobaculia bacterium]
MEPLFVFTDPELQSLLLDNHVNLVLELQRRGYAVEQTFLPDPAESSIEQSRDAILVILASAAAIVALGMAISEIIQALSRRPVLITNLRCQVSRGAEGEILRAPDGTPVMEWVQTSELLEVTQPEKSTNHLEANLGGQRGFRLHISRGASHGEKSIRLRL